MSAQHFFDFAAQAGITKHLGGLEATDELIQKCQITKGTKILDVGCGVGQTATYIASKIGANVTGIDINPNMIQRSKERAKKEGVTNLTTFKEADAQELPFPDNTYDAVITESVTAFPHDKQKAVNEYARVTKPGGYIGLNESTWLKTPPPNEIVQWVSQEVGATVKPLTREEWIRLLENADLIIMSERTSEIEIKKETKGIINRYGYKGIFMSLIRALKMYISNSAYRKFVTKIQKQGITPENIQEYFGYGIYIAQKPKTNSRLIKLDEQI